MSATTYGVTRPQWVNTLAPAQKWHKNDSLRTTFQMHFLKIQPWYRGSSFINKQFPGYQLTVGYNWCTVMAWRPTCATWNNVDQAYWRLCVIKDRCSFRIPLLINNIHIKEMLLFSFLRNVADNISPWTKIWTKTLSSVCGWLQKKNHHFKCINRRLKISAFVDLKTQLRRRLTEFNILPSTKIGAIQQTTSCVF